MIVLLAQMVYLNELNELFDLEFEERRRKILHETMYRQNSPRLVPSICATLLP